MGDKSVTEVGVCFSGVVISWGHAGHSGYIGILGPVDAARSTAQVARSTKLNEKKC